MTTTPHATDEDVKLADCPFCGSPAERHGGSVMCSSIECAAICGVPSTSFRQNHDPVAVWNTRAPPPSLPHSGEPVAWRWKPLVSKHWQYADSDTAFPDEAGELQPLYAPPPATQIGGGVEIEHTRSCGYFDLEIGCTCCLEERRALATEQTMHRAWRKRAEEVEANLLAVPKPQRAVARGNVEDIKNAMHFAIWSVSGPTNDAEVEWIEKSIEDAYSEYVAIVQPVALSPTELHEGGE